MRDQVAGHSSRISARSPFPFQFLPPFPSPFLLLLSAANGPQIQLDGLGVTISSPGGPRARKHFVRTTWSAAFAVRGPVTSCAPLQVKPTVGKLGYWLLKSFNLNFGHETQGHPQLFMIMKNYSWGTIITVMGQKSIWLSAALLSVELERNCEFNVDEIIKIFDK